MKPWDKTIGLTGSIGSGKSTVLKLLEKKGAFTLSADELSRRAVEPGSEALKEIVKEFGEEVLSPDDGSLDRKVLAGLVFQNKEKLQRLEAIIHPRIRELCLEELNNAYDNYPLLVYEVPLLFEKKLDSLGFKAIVVVYADNETCRARTMERDGLTREQAERRIEKQLSTEEKKRKADYIVNNSGSLNELPTQVEQLWGNLVTAEP